MKIIINILYIVLILTLLFAKSLLCSEQILYISEPTKATILQNKVIEEWPYSDEEVFFTANALLYISSEKIKDIKEEILLNESQMDLLKEMRAISIKIKQLKEAFLKADDKCKIISHYDYKKNITISKDHLQYNNKKKQDCELELKEKIMAVSRLYYQLRNITDKKKEEKIKVWLKQQIANRLNILPVKGKINKIFSNLTDVLIIATLEPIKSKLNSKEILLYKKNRDELLKDEEGNYLFQYNWDTSFWCDNNWKLKVRVHMIADSGGEFILNDDYSALPSYLLGNIEADIIDNNKCRIVINADNIVNMKTANLYIKHAKNVTDLTKGIERKLICNVGPKEFAKNKEDTFRLEIVYNINEFLNEYIQIEAEIINSNNSTDKQYSKVFWYNDTATDKTPPRNPTTCYAWKRCYNSDISRKENVLISERWYGLDDCLGFWRNEFGKLSVHPGVIEWFGARDEGAGIKGYHIYFGKDSKGIPESTLYTNNKCFIYDLHGFPINSESDINRISPKYVGINYFRISTEDLAGNISQPETIFIYKRDIGSPVGVFPKVETGKKWNYTIEEWWTKDQTPDVSIKVRDVVDWDQTLGGSGLVTSAYRYFPSESKDWSAWIEANLTGRRGSLDTETITAKYVPFFRNGPDNIVQFAIEDLVGNDTREEGGTFTTRVRVKINDDPIKFTNVWPKPNYLTGSNPKFKAYVKDIENVLLNSINIMVDDSIQVPIIGLNNFIYGTLENSKQYNLKPGLHTFTIYAEDGKYLDENNKGCPSIYNGSFVIVKPKVIVKYNKIEYKSGQEIKIKVNIDDDKFKSSGQRIFIKTQLYKDYVLNEDKRYITYPGKDEIIFKAKKNMPKDSYFILLKLYSEEDEINSIPIEYLEINGKDGKDK